MSIPKNGNPPKKSAPTSKPNSNWWQSVKKGSQSGQFNEWRRNGTQAVAPAPKPKSK